MGTRNTNTVYPAQITQYIEKYKAIKGDRTLSKLNLSNITIPSVFFKDGTKAPDELFKYIIVLYENSHKVEIIPEADNAAALLSYDSLCNAIESIGGSTDFPAHPLLIPTICRFGNSVQIKELLTKKLSSWSDWSRFKAKGRTACQKVISSIVLSDTREAVIWLEKYGQIENYAALRNASVEDIYDRRIFDFGFDKNGKQLLDIGTTVIELTLTSRFTVELYDTVNGKSLKSIPKKNTDPEIYQRSCAFLKDITQPLKKAARLKSNMLYSDFVNETEFDSTDWCETYLTNPFLKIFAQTLVWVQGNNTFLPIDDKAIDSSGKLYKINHLPIKLAHPMEMEKDDLDAWSKYFSDNGTVQPFTQIREPIIDKDSVDENRYVDCKIRTVYLRNQEKRGIAFSSYLHPAVLKIKGFDIKYSITKERVEINHIKCEMWNRCSNTVIAYLDRITIYGRIAKDDVTIVQFLPNFSLSQISDFIRIASDNNAVNVMAILLEYKEKTYSTEAVLDEFTLD